MEEEEKLQEKHKREQKQLQNNIQSLKHSVPKGDKKRKKEVNVEIAKMQAELDSQQQDELCNLKKLSDKEEDLVAVTEELSIEQTEVRSGELKQQQPKMSKAQKRREKKEAEERARQLRLEEGDKEKLNHARNIEAVDFNKLLQAKQLRIVEVQPDGDCLYSSVCVQLRDHSPAMNVLSLRKATCAHMLTHSEDYIAFTCSSTTGDILNQDEYVEYCEQIRDMGKIWGGQMELKAITQILQRPIEVYQTTASTVHIGEEFEAKPIRLSYHRHQYGLGEHYNAVLPDT